MTRECHVQFFERLRVKPLGLLTISEESRENRLMITNVATPPPPDWLDAFPALRGIQDPVWLKTVRTAKVMSVPAGVQVICKGDPCQQFLLVAKGTVRVFRSAESGREIAFYRTCAGDICIMTLYNMIQGTPYPAGAVTEDCVEVVAIPLPQFEKALAGSDEFRRYILGMLASRIGEMMKLVEQVLYCSLDLRLACLLGELFGRRNTAMLPITHQELADELGSTREVVSRLLKEFERLGCIQLRRGHIELVSRDALARLARENAM